MPQTFELLKSVTLTQATSTIDFTSVPTSYTDLYLIFNGQLEFGAGGRFYITDQGNPSYVHGYGGVTPTTQFTIDNIYNASFLNVYGQTEPGSGTFQAIINMQSYNNSGRPVIAQSILGRNADRIAFTVSQPIYSGINFASFSIDGNGLRWQIGTRARLYGILRA